MNTAPEHPDWKRMRFKRNKVWVALDETGHPRVEKGKVLIKYQMDQEHQYWVRQKSVHPLEEKVPDSENPDTKNPDTKKKTPHPAFGPDAGPKAIHIYTDGACSGNPGPAGIGVVMQYGRHRKEISEYIGTATNNIAELKAVRAALKAVKNRSVPVRIHTDSAYVLGLLGRGWKAGRNRRLVEAIRDLSGGFDDLQWIKVKGHAGHPGNERADQLAVQAIQKNS